jgi:hypothetical protein
MISPYIFRCINLYEGFSPNVTKHYRRYLQDLTVKKFVVTEGFSKLCTAVKSKESRISIGGPKGVGKSLALGAIATLCNKLKRPCFLWAPDIEMNSWFIDYVSVVIGKCFCMCGCASIGNGQLLKTRI